MAYLRGAQNIVRTGYSQGVRSIIREQLILNAVEMQMIADHGRACQHIQASLLAPNLKPSGLKGMLDQLKNELGRLYQISLLDPHGAQRAARGGAKAIATLYRALQKSKLFDLIREQHFEMNPQERPDA